jgi:hypothetical protein
LLPKEYSDILTSYIRERIFGVKFEDEYSGSKLIRAGVPQGSVLGPILYLLYTGDIPTTKDISLATLAEDTAVLTKVTDFEEAAVKAQKALLDITNWTKKLRIKLNEQKSAHINFTYKKNKKIQLEINGQPIPFVNEAKYLGMNLDVRLKWKAHMKNKKRRTRNKKKKSFMVDRTKVTNDNKQ